MVEGRGMSFKSQIWYKCVCTGTYIKKQMLADSGRHEEHMGLLAGSSG